MAGPVVTIRSDLRGRVVSVGTAAAPARFGAYAYAPDGALVGETQAGGRRARRLGYDGLRRVIALDDPAFALALSYRVGGGATGADGDGRIMGESLAYKAAAFSGAVPATTASAYRHDSFGRLVGVDASRQAAGALLGYDSDGNITAKAVGGAGASAYAYAAGANRLARVTGPSGGVSDLVHDAAGAVKGLGALALRHDGPGGRASRAATADLTARYLHNAAGERVLKRVRGAWGRCRG